MHCHADGPRTNSWWPWLFTLLKCGRYHIEYKLVMTNEKQIIQEIRIDGAMMQVGSRNSQTSLLT